MIRRGLRLMKSSNPNVDDKPRQCPKDGYPGHLWRPRLRQGQKGFNMEVRKVLEAILPGGAHAWRSPTQGDVTLLKQQMVATSLLHPGSPVSRILLDHNTGSGKTLIMLRVLDNYYHDAKAKIVIVPKDTVMWNFYSSLWEWPSSWRDYACQQIPRAVKLLCGSQGWCRRWPLATPTLCAEAGRQGLTLQQAIKALLLQPLRDCLEMKRAFYNGKVRRNFVQKYWAGTLEDDVHPPAAPLRVYRFTSAGGRASELDDGGAPRGCVFKVGFDGINPFSGKVILMDESHHLTRPSKQYEAQLNRLRNLVETAQGSVFVALTGSMASDAASARDLLSVVKGSTQAQPATDEGFLSSHNRRGAGFPRQKPAQCADGVLSEEIEGLIHKEELVGYSFIRYVYQSVKLHKENKSQDGLACYTNIHCYFGAVGNAVCQEQLLKYNSCRPKFSVAVDDVVAAARLKQKSLVVVSKRTGYKVMQWLLEAAGKKHGFNVADYDAMADFNKRDNAQGDRYMVMLLEAERGESIEFKCVRHALFLDVPSRYDDLKQRCGRVVRCRSHEDLEEEQRDVRFKFFVAEMPEVGKEVLGTFVLWALCGCWGGPKRINFGTEPDPDEIQETAEAVLESMNSRNILSLHDLVEEIGEMGCWALVTEAIDVEEQPKLAKRLRAGLAELQSKSSESISEMEELFQTTTFDEAKMEDLLRQVAETAPALEQVRCNAIDAGFY